MGVKISTDRWEKLSEKAQWDIKVALRGPDCHNSEPIKWFSTSVIRFACSDLFRVGGTVNDSIGFVVLPIGLHGGGLTDSDPDYKSPRSWNWRHFAQHVSDAANWLKIPIVWVKTEAWLKLLKIPDIGSATKTLLDGLYQSDDEIGKKLLTDYLKQVGR